MSRRVKKVWAPARAVPGAGWDPCPPSQPAQLHERSSSSGTLGKSAAIPDDAQGVDSASRARNWQGRAACPGTCSALCTITEREKELFFSKRLSDTSRAAYQQPDLDPEMSVPAQSRQGSIIRDALATYFSTDGDNV